MNCATCGGPIWMGNKTGYCRKHVGAALSASPEHAAKISAGLRRKMALDPVYREECRERARKNCASPKLREAAAKAARTSGAWRKALEAATPESYALGAKRSADTKLAWCPPELRDFYNDLKAKGIRAPEAKRLTLEQHEAEMARFRRKLEAA